MNQPLSLRDAISRDSTIPASRFPQRKEGSSMSIDIIDPTVDRGSDMEYLAVKGRLHNQLLAQLDEHNQLGANEEELAGIVREFVADILEFEHLPLNESERRRLVDDLLEETLGIGPLAELMLDPAVTDVLVNGVDQVFVERYGRLTKTDLRFRDTDHLVRIIKRIAARVGRRVDQSSPTVDARLPDGSRVNATLPPVSIDGPTLSIRRFGRQRFRRDELMKFGMFSQPMHQLLEVLVQARKNVLIAGGTGAGKSTVLGALAEAIPPDERVITIEDSAELQLDQEHVIRMETRPENVEGKGRISARDLVINALRMRPDRIILGEVRGGEAMDMLQAMNTGHDGGLTTIHANSPKDALSRLETMVLMAGLELPARAIREQIASAVDFVVYVRRFEDGARRLESISEMLESEAGELRMQEIFRFQRQGRSGNRVLGEFVPTGVIPQALTDLTERGFDLPATMFQTASTP